MNKYVNFATTLGNQAGIQAAGPQAPLAAGANPAAGVVLAPAPKPGMWDGPGMTSFRDEAIVAVARGAGEELGKTGMAGGIKAVIAKLNFF
jgi:hypothetical protein